MPNNSPAEISQELCKFISENLVAPDVVVVADAPLESLGLDSFSIIEIILFIERHYNLTLPDKEFTKENIYSPNSLANCIFKYI